MNADDYRRLAELKERMQSELPSWFVLWEGDDCFSITHEATVKVLFWLRHESDETKALDKAKRIQAVLA
jgi:hypothetical protein